MRLIRNQRGFSIAGVMVAAGILGIISLAALNVIGDIVAAGGKAKFDGEVINEVDLMRMSFKKTDICTLNLSGARITNNWTVVDASKLNFRLPSTTNPGQLGTDRILGADPYLKQLELKMEPGTTDIARARLRFDAKGKILGTQSVYRDVILAVTVDASHNLVSCTVEVDSESNEPPVEGRGCGLMTASSNSEPGHIRNARTTDANDRRSRIQNFCGARSYPMKQPATINFAPICNPFTGGLCVPTPEERGPYANNQKCIDQPLYAEGESFTSSEVIPNPQGSTYYGQSSPVYTCINKKWIKTGSVPSGTFHNGP